jgi:nucleoside-diphosphate-sugar epimerase
MQKVLLTAATGNIGAWLVPKLLATGAVKLLLPTSDARKLSSFNNSEHVSIIEGSISDPQWVEKQLQSHEIDTIFLCLFGIDEIFTVFNFLNAIQRSPCVKHVVYMHSRTSQTLMNILLINFTRYLSACGNFLNEPDSAMNWMCPHTKIKPPVEAALRNIKTFTHTIIGPSLFFKNDYRVKDAIVRGRRWVEPYGEKGTSRVAVEDIADAVVTAIRDRGRNWNGRKIQLGTLKQFTVRDSLRVD